MSSRFITVIIGAVCLYCLPVAQYPEIVPPTIQVTTRYPGASAEVVAATIGVPLEQAINGVEGSIYMSSVSCERRLLYPDGHLRRWDGSRHVAGPGAEPANGAVSQLPGGAQAQGVTVRKVSPNILLVASLYSDDERFEEIFLSNYALINLQNPLARIPGVGQVRIFGAGPYSMRVWLDPRRLQSFGLTTGGCPGRHPGPERPGRRRPARRSAGAGRSALPVHDQRPRPAFRRAPVRGDHRQERRRHGPAGRATARCRPGGLEPAELQQLFEIHRSQVGPDRGVRPAGRQRHRGRQSRLRGHGRDEQAVPRGHEVRDPVRHHPVRPGGDPRRLRDPVHRRRPGARCHLALPAELAGDARAGDDRAGDHHRRLHRHGRARLHREPHDPVRADPGDRHRGGRRHHHRGEQRLLHRDRDVSQGGHASRPCRS